MCLKVVLLERVGRVLALGGEQADALAVVRAADKAHELSMDFHDVLLEARGVFAVRDAVVATPTVQWPAVR